METLSKISHEPGGPRLLVQQAALVVEEGPDRDLVHELCELPVVIGRGETADLRLGDSSVSREHLVLRRDGLVWVAHDLGSKNGSRCHGVRFEAVPLEDGALLEIGDTRLRFRATPTEYAAAPRGEAHFDGILGDSPPMLELVGLLKRVAPLDLPVLLRGESGTGKERLARAVHDHGRAAGGPWVVVDCTLLRDPQMMRSELFGHRKGAFTGAEEARDGAFVQASGGTLFLDEVAELPLELQPQLLRVLQEGEVRPLGSDGPERVRVRVVAATHRDLEAMASRGEFREDLLHRLAAVTLTVPPLRERGQDIERLAESFLPDTHSLTARAREALTRHPWTGNVRELRNVLERAAAMAKGTRIDREDLALDARPAVGVPEPRRDGPPPESPRKKVEAITDEEILAALERTGGNRAAAARALRMGRRTLFRRLARMRDDEDEEG